MGEVMKNSLLTDWADVLDPYKLAEVKAACAALLGSNPKQATNEHQVKNVIVANRAKALARLPKQIEQEPVLASPHKYSEETEAVIKNYLDKRPRLKRAPLWKPSR